MLAKRTCIDDLQSAGFSFEDAHALRRISMTLHRWHELECGDSNDYASWCITRGHHGTRPPAFVHDEDGKPYLERHYYPQVVGQPGNRTTYTAIPDRERGALRRLARIMARYPGFASYVQGDPRGCALYIIPLDRLNTYDAANLDCCYTRGIAVYK